MRIGVDMHFAQGPLAGVGIGNYSFDHIAHLNQHPDIELIPFQPKFEGMTKARYVQELSRFIAENRIDIFHLPSPMTVPYPDVIGSAAMPPVRLTATFYDIIPYKYPEKYLPSDAIKRQYHLHLQMLNRIHRLFAISEYTRQDLLATGYPAEKVTTIGTGSSDFFFRLPNASVDDFQGVFPPDRPYILTISPIDFRKNVRRTVQAFAMATREQSNDVHLVVVGSAPDGLRRELEQIAAEHGRPNGVRFTGVVSKSQLLRLYNKAYALAFPSIYEGWGLPVLEALQCGTPVLTSASTSLPEAAGEAAVYVDPMDVQSIANGFRHLLYVPGARDGLAALAPQVAARHQWANVANKTIQGFNELMAAMVLPRPTAQPIRQRGQIRIKPNRYRLIQGGPKGSALPLTYVSFDLQQLPADARIVRAVLHFPMRPGAKRPLVRGVNRGWSVANVAQRRPLTRALKNSGLGIVTRRGKGVQGETVFHWPCTVLARQWRKFPLRNHGVMVRRALKRMPVLTITYSRVTTGYR